MKLRLSTQAILTLANALNAFDGLNQVQPGEKVKTPYKLAPGARMAMAKNLARANEVVDAYTKGRNGAIYHHAKGMNQFPDISKLAGEERDAVLKAMALLEQENAAMLEWVHEIDLVVIKEADLKIDDNDLPVQILSGLAPIIEGMAAEPAKISFKAAGPAVNGAAQANAAAPQ